MNPFIETLSICGAVATVIVASVIVLTLFYRGLNWLSGTGSTAERLAVRGVLGRKTLVTVHCTGGEVYERVRLIGYTDSTSMLTHLPYQLNGMVILENDEKTRFLIRAEKIKLIVISPPAPPAG